MRTIRPRLYTPTGTPLPDFNQKILGWLRGSQPVVEHNPPAAFELLRSTYDHDLAALLDTGGDQGLQRWQAHQLLLSNLTKMMFGQDITAELRARLSSENINPTGFRSTLSQGAAKNAGENFTNAIVYAVADALANQDLIVVDKGLPPGLAALFRLHRNFDDVRRGKQIKMQLKIESDFCIFASQDPTNAIVVSAKTRLKEFFHVGTMWKLFFDMLDDEQLLMKWGLQRDPASSGQSGQNILYTFATADMIQLGGPTSQGADVERDEPRNLIQADASFFDYVFVSKQGIEHVSPTLDLSLKTRSSRESLFHELGTLLDLIHQKFAPLGFSFVNL